MRPTASGVAFYTPEGAVHVDTRAHDIRLVDRHGERRSYGALRTGLFSSIDFLGEAFGVRVAGRRVAPALDAITDALTRSAAARGLVDRSLVAAIAELCPTPLLFAAPFLEARYVWQDAFRFRACRVAIAHVEDEHLDDDSPEAAAVVVEKLARWRELFARGAKPKRTLNTLLHTFGETLPAEALWGLRLVELRRPRQTAAPLELLGFMAAAGHVADGPRALGQVLSLVERASDGEVQRLLDGTLEPRAPRGSSPRDLALFLLGGDPESTTLLQLSRSAAERLAEQRRAGDAFPLPPIPLPADEGVRLLATVGELFAEGASMHHCVAGLAWRCLAGESYVFHVERAGTKATVHVDNHGKVVESRGPFNRPSLAAHFGAVALRRWGAGLWMHDLPLDALAWPPGLPVPRGARPLRSVRALVHAHADLVARGIEDAGHLASWFRQAARAAVSLEAGAYILDDAPDRVVLRSRSGELLGDTRVKLDVATPATRLPLVAALPPIPPPPIPPPRRFGLRFVDDARVLRGLAGLPPGAREEALTSARAGRCFLLRCDLDASGSQPKASLLVEVDRAGRTRIVGRPDVPPEVLARASALASDWAYGLWAARVGLGRCTWLGDRPVPRGAEALRTVDECLLVYESACLRRPDVDGALARFFEAHASAAVHGQAWLVVRERALGLVSVLDARGRVKARSEDAGGGGRRARG